MSDPAAFQSLRRTYHFDTVFLPTGAVYSLLREKLLESPLWVLSDVMPEGYLFRQAGSTCWNLANATQEDLKEKDPSNKDPKALETRRIAVAENLIAIGRTCDAESLLSIAADSRSRESRRLAALASLEAARGHWNAAMDLANQSLRMKSTYRPARIVLVRALAESGHSDQALREAKNLAELNPDAETLFLLARAANADGDRPLEIATLQRLVEEGKRTNQPLGASLLYLGQALGHEGRQGEALRALDEAGQCPELTPEQISLIRDLRSHLAPSSIEP